MKMMSRFVAALLLAAATSAIAGELRVQAPVVDVQPISAPPTRIEHCDDKPLNGSLAQTMAWDLGLNCREEVLDSGAITGYRVFYRWDDRVYSQVMGAAPGATVPLKIRIN
jgi:hypothetical protein